MKTNWTGRTATSGRSGYGHTTTYKPATGRTTTRSSTKPCSSKYTSTFNCFATKMNSYKTLYNQTWGSAKYSRPTPATLNTFSNWINKGSNVYTVSRIQLNRWAGSQKAKYDWNKTTQCKSFLATKFGKSTIKAVAQCKNGSYMVACAPIWKGKQFRFPH